MNAPVAAVCQVVALALTGTALSLSAGCRCDAPPSERKHAATNSPPASSKPAAAHTPTTLLEWPESAYGTTLFIEGSTVLLLTPTAAIRVTEGTPPQKMTLPLGAGPALMGDSIVYWHDGAVRAVSKQGSEPRALGALEQAPQRLVASENRLAWLERTDGGSCSLHTFDGKKSRELYRTPAPITTAAMLGDRVYFVEGHADGSWRIGLVSVRQRGIAFSLAHPRRTPAMIVPRPDGVYFYDGPTRSVRHSSPDLLRETIFAENVICSPLAVFDRIVCGHVEGVFEIPRIDQRPRVLSPERSGPIAAIAVDDKRVVWVVDSGADRLALRSLALPPLP